jgi:hypothetical protein
VIALGQDAYLVHVAAEFDRLPVQATIACLETALAGTDPAQSGEIVKTMSAVTQGRVDSWHSYPRKPLFYLID